jgi:hypothetical protein
VTINGHGPHARNREQLRADLERTVAELNVLAATIVSMAEAQRTDPFRLQYASGELALGTILPALGQAQAALAMLMIVDSR